MANTIVKGIRFYKSAVTPSGPPAYIRGALASGYGTALYVGQPVIRVDAGYFQQAPAGGNVFGIVAAIEQYYDSGAGRIVKPLGPAPKFIPASTTYTGPDNESRIAVIPVVGNYFVIDGSGAISGATRAAAIALRGSNADHVISTGDCTLDTVNLEANDATPASAQWTVVDFVDNDALNSDFTAARLKWIVSCNKPQLVAASVGL